MLRGRGSIDRELTFHKGRLEDPLRVSSRVAIFTVCVLLGSCVASEPPGSPQAQQQPSVPLPVAAPSAPPAPVASDSLDIRFDALSAKEGLRLTITAVGDSDGETAFSNKGCCGIKNVRRFISDVRVHAGAHSVPTAYGALGWTVRHAPGAVLTVTYRLRASGATTLDSGIFGHIRPIVHDGLFHLIGDTALLLPTGRAESDLVELGVDARNVASDTNFVSSFGPGNTVRGLIVPRSQIGKALYLGGSFSLVVRDTPVGRIGVAYSAMDATIRANDLRSDAFAIVEATREFFNDTQPWYLISVHGGNRLNPKINLSGGTGLTNSFVMFAWSGLDFANKEHREQFRWVLAHEYFHQWNGLTLRVAPRPGSTKDDISAYWFSEGVTDFYTMRLLTRAGLQSPGLSLGVLDDRLARYAKNSKRGLSSEAAGAIFWTDSDGEQIPYLRGYLAAWYVDLAQMRATDGSRGLDDLIRALVVRAKKEPDFRVDSSFLAAYLGEGLPTDAANKLRKFVINGGESPLAPDSFAPCLVGRQESISGRSVLQFDFADTGYKGCFRH